MNCMFCFCESLTSLNLSNFVTNEAYNLKFMFYRCIKLTSLNLSNFDITKITQSEDIEKMFWECNLLKYIDISGFITEIKLDIFNTLSKGCSIKIKNETVDKIVKNPGCTLDIL